MEKPIAEKQLGEFVKVEAKFEAGKLVAEASLDVGAILDKGAAELKAKIPGSAEEPFVDAIVKMLKEQIGLVPAPVASVAV